jgi:hypothetical protein
MTIITDTKEPNIRTIHFELEISQDDIDHIFNENEKEYLRPIAETLAMLDGNAFFEMSSTLWESYLPEARALFNSNGGLTGWAGGASWIKDLQHETPAVKEAYKHYRLLKTLSKGESNE